MEGFILSYGDDTGFRDTTRRTKWKQNQESNGSPV